MEETYSITVTGNVQGVFFRQTTKEKADKLGLKGTVENKEDESVVIIATGPKEQLNELVKCCHEGPPRAKVENVIVQKIPLQEFYSFSIKRW
jgi:acylphosphatase